MHLVYTLPHYNVHVIEPCDDIICLQISLQHSNRHDRIAESNLANIVDKFDL